MSVEEEILRLNFDYSCFRRTYAPSLVADVIYRNRSYVSNDFLKHMKETVDEGIKNDRFENYYKREWISFFEKLKNAKEIKKPLPLECDEEYDICISFAFRYMAQSGMVSKTLRDYFEKRIYLFPFKALWNIGDENLEMDFEFNDLNKDKEWFLSMQDKALKECLKYNRSFY